MYICIAISSYTLKNVVFVCSEFNGTDNSYRKTIKSETGGWSISKFEIFKKTYEENHLQSFE